MSEQTQQPTQSSQKNEMSSQNERNPAMDEDITTSRPAQNAELTSDTMQEKQASGGIQDAEVGDATAPVSVEAQTIQIPPMSVTDGEERETVVPSAPMVQVASSLVAAPVQTVAPSVTATAQAGIPKPFMSFADVAQLQLAEGPQVSPDGLLIAYSLMRSSLEENTTRSSIWLVPTVAAMSGKSQPPRQLTADMYNSMMPRWSPDGRTLAFVSDRSGTAQIYLLPLNGGEARQVSFLKEAVTEFCWRPDGRALLVQSPWKRADDQPQAKDKRFVAKDETLAAKDETFAAKDETLVEDETLVQVWTRLDETWDGIGYKKGRHQHLWLIDLESEQAATRLTFEPIDHVQACWSPDGAEIAFCANRRTAPDLSVSTALWVLTLASGRLRRLSPLEGLAQQPAWSPNGKWLAFYFAQDQSETANIVPWIVEANGQSAPRPATTVSQSQTSLEMTVDNLHYYYVSRPCWYPDSTSLMVTVQTRGQVHLNRLYINTNHEEPLTTGNGCYLTPHMSTNGRTIATLRTDWFTPGDIWALAGNGANRRRLTAVNDALMRNRQLIRPKKVSWLSFDKQEIEGWLYLPTLPPGQRAPLILDVHGGPTLAWAENYVHDFQVLAGLGYAVLAANPRGSAGYGEEFCRKIINDWGGDDFRDLMLGLDHIIATEPIDGSRLAITGASYGGYMTCWAITQTKRFKAAVARNPVTSLLTCSLLSDQAIWLDLIIGTQDQDQDPETLRRSCSPMTFADAITTPLLLIHSTEDLRCPPNESKQLFHVLRRRQHPVELALYPGVSHLLDLPGYGSPKQRVDRLHRSAKWFRKYV
jgi:dipeptidyl aminopeptidase/acylaminoacyl peptidase